MLRLEKNPMTMHLNIYNRKTQKGGSASIQSLLTSKCIANKHFPL